MNVSSILPAKVRKVVYGLLATLYAFETAFDFVDGATESRALAFLTLVGFGLALKNTTDVVVVSDDPASR